MLVLAIVLVSVLLLAAASGFATYKVKKIKKRKALEAYLEKMGYDKIGYA